MIEQTTEPKPQETAEANVYASVYKVLLAGMYTSTALFLAGIIGALIHPRFVPLTSDWVRSHYHWHVLLSGLKAADPTSVMLVATLLLILTPVARVAVSIYAFAVDRDYKYVVVTGTVLAVMALALVFGLLGLS